MADRKMQVERGNLAPYIVVNRDAAVAGVFSVDGEKGAVNLEGKYAKISDVSSSNQEIEKLKPRVTAVESGLNETNITVKKIDDTIDKVEPASVIFNRDVLAKEVGVGYPRVGTSPSTRFGYHNTSATTPRLYIANGNVGKTIQIPFDDGTMATREWTNQYVGPTISGGSQLQHKDSKNSIAVNPNGNCGFWDATNERWLIRANTTGAMDLSKEIYMRNTDPDTTSSKIEIVSPDNGSRVGLWAYNDKRTLISGYKNGSWTNIDIADIPTKTNVGWGIAGTNPDNISNLQDHGQVAGQKRYVESTLGIPGNVAFYGSCITSRYDNSILQHLLIPNYGDTYLAVKRFNGGQWEARTFLSSNQYFVDGSGYYKKSSPIIKIFRYGDFETNEESDGAKVSHVAKGVYKITGVLGMNSDGAWGGMDGGVDVPVDNNRQPKLWVDYSVEKNGDIIIKTYHREHLNSPLFAQNKIDGYKDGDPINIPADTFISVRVQMPENSKWNIKQKEAEEFHNKELDNGKEILNSDD